MNEQDKKEIFDYLKTLPKEVKKLISDPVIETRIDDIIKKYSLNIDQAEYIQTQVFYILSGLDEPLNFTEQLAHELSISNILAIQISTELEERVFKYASEYIEKSIENTENISKTLTDFGELKSKANSEIPTISVPRYIAPQTAAPEPTVVKPWLKPIPEALQVKKEEREAPKLSSSAPENLPGMEILPNELGNKPIVESRAQPNNFSNTPSSQNTGSSRISFKPVTLDENGNKTVTAEPIAPQPAQPVVATPPQAPQVKPAEQAAEKTAPTRTTDPYREPIQ